MKIDIYSHIIPMKMSLAELSVGKEHAFVDGIDKWSAWVYTGVYTRHFSQEGKMTAY